jgi:hypothetical protein
MPQSLFPRRYYIDSEGADVSSLASRQNRPGNSSNAVRQDLVAHFASEQKPVRRRRCDAPAFSVLHSSSRPLSPTSRKPSQVEIPLLDIGKPAGAGHRARAEPAVFRPQLAKLERGLIAGLAIALSLDDIRALADAVVVRIEITTPASFVL